METQFPLPVTNCNVTDAKIMNVKIIFAEVFGQEMIMLTENCGGKGLVQAPLICDVFRRKQKTQKTKIS